jgi:sulfate adenylyltransferase (ADP) / ATP adenylyltransferase
VPFLVRSVSSLERKRLEARRLEGANDDGVRNPLMPPEPPLTVGDITPTHIGVLNKYPVVEHHLLIVTKAAAPQEAALDRDDFLAVARCLAEIDGLVFYNGGRKAGASQPHKHLQLVQLPLGPGSWAAPMEAVFDSWAAGGNTNRLLRLPFRNAFSLLDGFDDEPRAAERLEELYAAQLAAIGAVDADAPHAANDEPVRPASYNLLVTRRWMLAVPRSRERFGTISINALGFAGSLFVRDEDEMQDLLDAGTMRALKAVSVA